MSLPWLVATLALMVAFALGAGFLACATVPNRLVAVSFTGNMAVLALAAMTFVFDQASAIDIALALALLQVPGTLLYCLFEERWL